MAELEFNIARLQQCLDVTVGTPSIGDVVQVTSTSPLTFDIAPGGGGTGTVNTIVAEVPITVDASDPANPVVGVTEADGAVGQAGVVSDKDQVFNGIKTFLDVPRSSNAPLNSDDITNKAYVDTFAAGLQVKAAVRAATLVAGTLASSFENGDIIDGVTLATGDRILIKNQASAIENGIFTVNVSGAPTRATDYNDPGEANAGTFTTVIEGSQGGKTYAQIEANPTPGTDPMNFTILNIGVAVSSIQSPNTAHGTSGTLIGAVKLDSTDIYYNGVSGNTVKQEMVTVTTAGNASPQVISGAKKFTGAVDLTTSNATAQTLTTGTVGTRLATVGFATAAAALRQPLSTRLTNLAGLTYTAPGFPRLTATNTWTLDTTAYATQAALTAGLTSKLDVTTAASTYAPIASPTFTGSPTVSGPVITPSTDSSTKIATTAFVQSALASNAGVSIKVHLSSADLLSLSGANPKLCIGKPGVGYAINVLAFAYKYNSVTTDYTNTSVLYLVTKTLNVSLYSIPAIVITNGSKFITSPLGMDATSSNLKENEDIVLDCIASPTLGNGTLDLYITYQIIAL